MTTDQLYPLELGRFLSTRLWGGDRLRTFLGLSEPAGDEPLGEAWGVYSGNPAQCIKTRAFKRPTHPA